MRVEAGDTGEASVDHGADAGNRQRGLGDISRHDDLAAWARLDGAILLFGRQFAVKRKDIDATGLGKIPHRADGAHDFI